jgi:hypothetical protein
MENEITICVYKEGSRGKKVCRKNGKRITKKDAFKQVEGLIPTKTNECSGYTELLYKIK